jgi:hypothetical protein
MVHDFIKLGVQFCCGFALKLFRENRSRKEQRNNIEKTLRFFMILFFSYFYLIIGFDVVHHSFLLYTVVINVEFWGPPSSVIKAYQLNCTTKIKKSAPLFNTFFTISHQH